MTEGEILICEQFLIPLTNCGHSLAEGQFIELAVVGEYLQD